MASVRFEAATRVYPGSDHTSVDSLTLDVDSGELLVLLGPQGSGKSTALRMLAGLEEVTSGHIYIDDQDVTEASPRERDVAMVFQNYALYPHMTVADNMGFALRIAGVPTDEISARVHHAASVLGLEDVLDSRPQDLPGGVDRQRVAMGRAIVREPRVFMMDEPLANLESETRERTRAQIADLQRQLGITTIFATSDAAEGLSIADRVAVLDRGVLQQVASPERLRERPDTVFVAKYVGWPLTVMTQLTAQKGRATWGELSLEVPELVSDGESVVLGVHASRLHVVGQPGRPADHTDQPEAPASGTALSGTVTGVETHGENTYVTTDTPVNQSAHALVELAEAFADSEGVNPPTPTLSARVPPDTDVNVGDTVWVAPEAGSLHWFRADSGARIGE